jgi:hypothetical protein
MTHRTCFRCNQSFEATHDNFYREMSRPLGLAYECKGCHKERKAGRDRRKERWSNMTDDQKEKARVRNLRWQHTPKGRAIMLQKAYRRIDSCDLTVEEIVDFTSRPCVYCGTVSLNRGLDRIDNSLPHIRGNVQTACADCNIVRGARFSVEEMKLLGKVIAHIRSVRDTSKLEVQNEGHLEKNDSESYL